MATVDIAPELLEKVLSSYEDLKAESDTIQKILKKVSDATISYQDAHMYAIEVGDLLSEAFGTHITTDVLPNGKMYFNIAEKIIPPSLQKVFSDVSSVAMKAQEVFNESEGVGLKAVSAEIDADRIDGVVNKIAESESFDKSSWMLGEPVKNFAQHVVDQVLMENANYQWKAGREPTVQRRLYGGACDWCKNLAGTYFYSDVMDTGNDVWRRHDYCRCTILFKGYGKIHGVHSQNVYTDTSKKTERQAYANEKIAIEEANRNKTVQKQRQKVVEEYRNAKASGKEVRAETAKAYQAEMARQADKRNATMREKYGADYLKEYTANKYK